MIENLSKKMQQLEIENAILRSQLDGAKMDRQVIENSEMNARMNLEIAEQENADLRRQLRGKEEAYFGDITAFIAGYQYVAAEMQKQREQAYQDGALYAIHEVGKEMDAGSCEIRRSGDTIDGMCAHLAGKIKNGCGNF